MKKLIALAAALVVVPILAFAAPVFADSPGQLSNGSTNYKVRNVTTNGDYSQAVSAVCNDKVKYSITLSNSDFGLLKDLTVKADLASGAITASAKNTAGDTTTVSGSAKVNTTGTLKYIAGSTVRITGDTAQTETAQADGITTTGVNVGDLNGSTYIFVQFQAQVACDAPKECKPGIPVGDARCKDVPTTLVNTGAGSVFGIVAAVTVAGALAHRLVLARRS